MKPHRPIRPDIHERFVAVVTRADAKLERERKAMERKHVAALAGERNEAALGRSSDADGEDDAERPTT